MEVSRSWQSDSGSSNGVGWLLTVVGASSSEATLLLVAGGFDGWLAVILFKALVGSKGV